MCSTCILEKNNDVPVVSLRGLTTGYRTRSGEVVVSRDISAALYSSELTCLLGPNGAGKSTLMRTLSGFQPPLSGEVLIEGLPVESYSQADLSRIVGVVLTDRIETTGMTVEDLVGLGRSPYTGFWGRLGEADHRIVEEAMGLVGISGLGRRMVHTLSDGERQKVMIAKALAQQTPVILLDEPTAFLDFPSKVEVMQLLGKLSRLENRSILISTHDVEIALRTSRYLWLLDREHGLACGTPDALASGIGVYFNRPGVSYDPSVRRFDIDPEYS